MRLGGGSFFQSFSTQRRSLRLSAHTFRTFLWKFLIFIGSSLSNLSARSIYSPATIFFFEGGLQLFALIDAELQFNKSFNLLLPLVFSPVFKEDFHRLDT